MKIIALKGIYIFLLFIVSISIMANNDSDIDANEEIERLLKKANIEKNTNVSEALITIQQAISFADSIKNDNLLLRSKNSYSLYLLMSASYEESKLEILEILPIYEERNHVFQMGVLYNRLGYIYLKTQNYIEASEYLHKALVTFSEKSFRQIGITHTYLTNLYVQLQNYDTALEHIEIALQNLSRSKSKQYENMALTELGMLQFKIKDYTQAKESFHQALGQKIDNDQFKILPLLYLGLIEFHNKSLDTAEDYLIQAVTFCHQTGNIQELPKVNQYLSQISLSKNNISEAFTLAQKSLSISKNHDLISEEFQSYLLLCKLNYDQGQYQKSINFGEKVFYNAKGNHDYELLYQSANHLANTYAAVGDFEKSYNYRTEHQKAKDIYMNSQNIINVIAKTTKFRLDHQRKQQVVDREEQLARQKLYRNIGIIASLFFALFSLISNQLNLKRKKANKALKSKNKQLIQAELNLENLNKELESQNDKLNEYIDVNLQLENFTHIASNDLKAPLREQASFIQLLEKDTLLKINEKEQSYLSIISKSNSDMQTLIEDMIEYSLIKSDDYELTEIDPSLIIKKAEYLNRDLIHKEKATIILKDIPSLVKGDSDKLIVAFRNLIHNSLTYKRDGIKPIIEIGGEQRNGYNIFYIRDNGKGIHPHYRKDIFDIFKRLSNNPDIPGNGVGLAIVKQVAEKHNGQVWLESESEKGSTFYFSIAA